MMRRFFLYALLGLFLVNLWGCSGNPIQKPKISVRHAEISRISFKESTAVFTIRVDNPNDFPIYLNGVDYGMSLNNNLVAEGSYDSKTTIPARKSKRLDMPVKIRITEIFGLIPSFIRQGQVRYTLEGTVKTPIIHLPFHKVGGLGVKE
jgi:LEA14-like dessication related protein